MRRDEVPASVLDDVGIYLLISKWEQQCQRAVGVLCAAEKVPHSLGEILNYSFIFYRVLTFF